MEFEDTFESTEQEVSEEELEVESWLSGQTWYLLTGLMFGFLVNMLGRFTAVQRGGAGVASSMASAAGHQPTGLAHGGASQSSAASLWTANFTASKDSRMYFVVRSDLKMSPGKVASQTAHAAIMCFKRAARECPQQVRSWELQGQPKIVLKTKNPEDLARIEAEAQAAGVVTALVRDAGNTQVASGSATVLGMGPAPTPIFAKLCSNLKLY